VSHQLRRVLFPFRSRPLRDRGRDLRARINHGGHVFVPFWRSQMRPSVLLGFGLDFATEGLRGSSSVVSSLPVVIIILR
jgi:hypothetical protein